MTLAADSISMRLLITLLLTQSAPPRAPVPADASQRESENLVREVFKEDYARTAPADRKALARKLLQEKFRVPTDATVIDSLELQVNFDTVEFDKIALRRKE